MNEQEMPQQTILGSKMKDAVTGQRGTVTGILTNLHGPKDYRLEGSDKAGTPFCLWVQWDRLTEK